MKFNICFGDVLLCLIVFVIKDGYVIVWIIYDFVYLI